MGLVMRSATLNEFCSAVYHDAVIAMTPPAPAAPAAAAAEAAVEEAEDGGTPQAQQTDLEAGAVVTGSKVEEVMAPVVPNAAAAALPATNGS